jgi:hypothetical protein
MFGIDQSTVSRIIQRYERWQAHAKDRENGRLDRSERLRAQRWLTYERNELILGSCLRIAQEMERVIELSKSTIWRPIDRPSQQSEILSEERVIDRSGVAARFLRLAYRINMDQLKLAAQFAREEAPHAEPLTDEEFAAEAEQAALDAAEIAAARQQGSGVFDEEYSPMNNEYNLPKTPDSLGPQAEPHCDAEPGAPGCSQPGPDGGIHASAGPSAPPDSTSNLEPQTSNAAVMHPMHNLHTDSAPKTAVTSAQPCTCAMQVGVKKNSLGACITDGKQTTSSEIGDSNSGPATATDYSTDASVPVAVT